MEPFVAAGRAGRDGVVCSGDAVAAVVGHVECPVIDEYAAPADQAPIDVGAIFKERLPLGFTNDVGVAFVCQIIRWRGDIPTHEVVGGEVPRPEWVDLNTEQFVQSA